MMLPQQRMDRARALRALADETFDLLVIGGGITGAGVAREASLRGFAVALVEQADFASGTSSRSTKLIHGGLRYLKQFDFKLVAEAVRERQLLLNMAPQLVEPTRFLFPVFRGDPDSLLALRAGLTIYDLFARLQAPIPHRMLNASAVMQREPDLRRDGLVGGAVYTDSRTDDGRLTLAVIQSAHMSGATLANYVVADGFLHGSGGRATGARVTDTLGGEQFNVRAARVLCAGGPWADELRHLEDQAAPRVLHLTKGVHVAVASERLELTHAVVMRSDDAERRMMFAIPHGRYTYLGTTDTDYRERPESARVLAGDVEYILAATNRTFPDARLTEIDVASTWVGLRPLVRPPRQTRPSVVSRDYQLFHDQSGVACVAGGKLTAFRAMAQHIVDQLMPGSQSDRSRYASLAPLPGADAPLPTEQTWNELAHATGVAPAQLREWCGTYGSRVTEVAAHLPHQSSGDAGLDWHRAMTRYAVQYEAAQRLEDVYRRRTGLMLFSRDNGCAWLEPLADEMAAMLGWSAERRRDEISRTRTAIDRMFAFRVDSLTRDEPAHVG
jgi:glycerol-3-phosphate dehydrogenase